MTELRDNENQNEWYCVDKNDIPDLEQLSIDLEQLSMAKDTIRYGKNTTVKISGLDNTLQARIATHEQDVMIHRDTSGNTASSSYLPTYKTHQCPYPLVHMFQRPSLGFELSTDPTTPVIMIGPGTGVAPFIGFLIQRQVDVINHSISLFAFFFNKQTNCPQ